MTDTAPAATLHCYLGYRDAPAALHWLGEAFGFETTSRFDDDGGGVMHSELRLGDVAIVVFSDVDGYERPPRRGDTAGQGLYVCLPSAAAVDALHRRAVGAGATEVWAPGDTEWGNHRFRVLDPEGFEWTFGTHRPGAPAQW